MAGFGGTPSAELLRVLMLAAGRLRSERGEESSKSWTSLGAARTAAPESPKARQEQWARNIALALRYYEECPPDDGDPEKSRAQLVVDEILSPDFTMYFNCEAEPDAAHGRDEHKQFLVAHTRAFAGERWTVEVIVADAQTVACQWRCQAAHRETNNPIDMHAADFFTGTRRAPGRASSLSGLQHSGRADRTPGSGDLSTARI